MQKEHTPGPWSWVPVPGDTCYGQPYELTAADGTTIASDGSAWGEYGQVTEPESANGKLIAAAPDLLDALRSIRLFALLQSAAPSDAFGHIAAKCSQTLEKAGIKP